MSIWRMTAAEAPLDLWASMCSADQMRAAIAVFMKTPPAGGRAVHEEELRKIFRDPARRLAGWERLSPADRRTGRAIWGMGGFASRSLLVTLGYSDGIGPRSSLGRAWLGPRGSHWSRPNAVILPGDEPFLRGPAPDLGLPLLESAVLEVPAAAPNNTFLLALRAAAVVAESRGWKLKSDGAAYVRDLDDVVAAVPVLSRNDGTSAERTAAARLHATGVVQTLVHSGDLVIDGGNTLRVPPSGLTDPSFWASMPRRLLFATATSDQARDSMWGQDDRWLLGSFDPAATINLALAIAWHTPLDRFVDVSPIMASLMNRNDIGVVRDSLRNMSTAKEAAGPDEDPWSASPRSRDRILVQRATKGMSAFGVALGLWDIGRTANGLPCLRPTPFACAIARDEPWPAAGTEPRAWLSSTGDLVVDLQTVGFSRLAPLVPAARTVSVLGPLATLAMDVDSMQRAVRAGWPVEAIEDSFRALVGRAPPWWTFAQNEHARSAQELRLHVDVRCTVSPDGAATIGPRPASAGPDKPKARAYGTHVSWSAALRVRRDRDGRLHWNETAGPVVPEDARIMRLCERNGGALRLTRASVQAALRAGVSVTAARDWMDRYVRFEAGQGGLPELLLDGNPLKGVACVFVSLPSLFRDLMLPKGLASFEPYRLPGNGPGLILPPDRVPEWEAALAALALTDPPPVKKAESNRKKA